MYICILHSCIWINSSTYQPRVANPTGRKRAWIPIPDDTIWKTVEKVLPFLDAVRGNQSSSELGCSFCTSCISNFVRKWIPWILYRAKEFPYYERPKSLAFLAPFVHKFWEKRLKPSPLTHMLKWFLVTKWILLFNLVIVTS